MPRELTYTKYKSDEPYKGHMQNITELVENSFPVGVKLYSSDAPPRGNIYQTIPLNITVARVGYDGPINIKVGILADGSSVSSFRPLASVSNVNPSNDAIVTVPISIPFDLSGNYPLWYYVEPTVADVLKAPRIEILTNSPIASDIVILTVITQVLRTLVVNHDVLPYRVELYEGPTLLEGRLNPNSTSVVFSVNANAPRNLRVVSQAEGYYTSTKTLYCTDDATLDVIFTPNVQVVNRVLNATSNIIIPTGSTSTQFSSPVVLDVLYASSIPNDLLAGEYEHYRQVIVAGLKLLPHIITIDSVSWSYSEADKRIRMSAVVTVNRLNNQAESYVRRFQVTDPRIGSPTLAGTFTSVNEEIFETPYSGRLPAVLNLGSLEGRNILKASELESQFDIHVQWGESQSSPSNKIMRVLSSSSNFIFSPVLNKTGFGNSPDVVDEELPPDESMVRYKVKRANNQAEGLFNIIIEFYNDPIYPNQPHPPMLVSYTATMSAERSVNAVSNITLRANQSTSRKGILERLRNSPRTFTSYGDLPALSSPDVLHPNVSQTADYHRLGPYHIPQFDPISLPSTPKEVNLILPTIPSETSFRWTDPAEYNNRGEVDKENSGFKVLLSLKGTNFYNGDGQLPFLNAVKPRKDGILREDGTRYIDMFYDIYTKRLSRPVIPLDTSIITPQVLASGLRIAIVPSFVEKILLSNNPDTSASTFSQFSTILHLTTMYNIPFPYILNPNDANAAESYYKLEIIL